MIILYFLVYVSYLFLPLSLFFLLSVCWCLLVSLPHCLSGSAPCLVSISPLPLFVSLQYLFLVLSLSLSVSQSVCWLSSHTIHSVFWNFLISLHLFWTFLWAHQWLEIRQPWVLAVSFVLYILSYVLSTWMRIYPFSGLSQFFESFLISPGIYLFSYIRILMVLCLYW